MQDVGGEPLKRRGCSPAHPLLRGFDVRRAATTRRFGALGREARGRADDPSPDPSHKIC